VLLRGVADVLDGLLAGGVGAALRAGLDVGAAPAPLRAGVRVDVVGLHRLGLVDARLLAVDRGLEVARALLGQRVEDARGGLPRGLALQKGLDADLGLLAGQEAEGLHDPPSAVVAEERRQPDRLDEVEVRIRLGGHGLGADRAAAIDERALHEPAAPEHVAQQAVDHRVVAWRIGWAWRQGFVGVRHARGDPRDAGIEGGGG
jgi:hypothetical protein